MSDQVRRLRRALDLTQAELARRVGISRQALITIEKGGTPSLSTALALGRELGTRVADLFPQIDRMAAEAIDAVRGDEPKGT